ncbi:DUF6457 domain-containing protein [Dermabacteraceae bacterium P13115]|nr:hypothetical protein [Dermabacteraceae bacterium TAE3-ERU5]
MARKDDPRVIATLNEWATAVSQDLEMEQVFDEDSVGMYLALTGAAAVEVVRPAAPFVALFAGYLYGAGRADSLEEAADLAAQAMRRHLPVKEEEE